MYAIIRNYPKQEDQWFVYDYINCYKSYENLNDAKKHEEYTPQHKVIKLIPENQYEKYYKYLRDRKNNFLIEGIED